MSEVSATLLLPPIQVPCWGWHHGGVSVVKLVNKAGADKPPWHVWYDLEAQCYYPTRGRQAVTQWQVIERPGQGTGALSAVTVEVVEDEGEVEGEASKS